MNVFHGDPDWQDALTKRERERAFWKEQDAKAKAIVEARAVVVVEEEKDWWEP